MQTNFHKIYTPKFFDTDQKIEAYIKQLININAPSSNILESEEKFNFSTKDDSSDSSTLIPYLNLDNNQLFYR